MWPTEKTSRPTDSALLSVYKLNIWRSATGPARLNGPQWDVWTGPKGTVLNVRWLGGWPGRTYSPHFSTSSAGSQDAAREIPDGQFALIVKPAMTTNPSRRFIHVRKCWSDERTNCSLVPPSVRAPKERTLFLWGFPHTVLSKQIHNSEGT